MTTEETGNERGKWVPGERQLCPATKTFSKFHMLLLCDTSQHFSSRPGRILLIFRPGVVAAGNAIACQKDLCDC